MGRRVRKRVRLSLRVVRVTTRMGRYNCNHRPLRRGLLVIMRKGEGKGEVKVRARARVCVRVCAYMCACERG